MSSAPPPPPGGPQPYGQGQPGAYPPPAQQPGAYPPVPPAGYGPPAPAAATGGGQFRPDELNNVRLNLWLSVFFFIIPALIFYFSGKATSSPLINDTNRKNLNFQLTRLIVVLAAAILGSILVAVGASSTTGDGNVNGLVVFGGILAFVGYFYALISGIFGIVHAISVPGQLESGRPGKFYLTINLIK